VNTTGIGPGRAPPSGYSSALLFTRPGWFAQHSEHLRQRPGKGRCPAISGHPPLRRPVDLPAASQDLPRRCARSSNIRRTARQAARSECRWAVQPRRRTSGPPHRQQAARPTTQQHSTQELPGDDHPPAPAVPDAVRPARQNRSARRRAPQCADAQRGQQHQLALGPLTSISQKTRLGTHPVNSAERLAWRGRRHPDPGRNRAPATSPLFRRWHRPDCPYSEGSVLRSMVSSAM